MTSQTQLRARRAGLAVVLLLPAGLLAALAVVSGGFFPDATAVAAIVVVLVLVVRATSARVPFAGLSAGSSIAASALIAFAVWTLISGSWSGSPSRALLEYNRALLYLGVLVLTGSLARSTQRARILLLGLAAAAAAVSVAALATWLLPRVFPAGESFSRDRLGWPTTYWNATGLIAALAVVWSAGLTCSGGERAWVRVAAATAAPLAAAALIFTVSRGAVAVAVLGLVVALVAIRSRAMLPGLAVLLGAVGVAVLLALAVDGLNTHRPSADAIADGRRTALLLAVTAVCAGVARTALVPLDRRLARPRRAGWDARTRQLAALAAAAVAVVAFIVAGGPGEVRTAVQRFVDADSQSVAGNVPARERLTRLGNNGRIKQWRVAVDDGFRPDPITGAGAGTYAVLWTRYGGAERRVLDAHSLYAEQLGELGIVGAALLVITLVCILVALAVRARGPDRAVWGTLLGGAVVWTVHAGVDWDWEMPAVTAWVFAAGGLALAAAPRPGAREPARPLRLAIGLGCLILCVTPALIWRSQTTLTDAVAALQRGDCLTATREALASNAAVGARPEPFEIITYCEAGAGRLALALRAVAAAERRDPDNWELRYAEALVRGAAGLDPRPAARAALARYPASELVRRAERGFATSNRKKWRRFAVTAPLPLPPPTK